MGCVNDVLAATAVRHQGLMVAIISREKNSFTLRIVSGDESLDIGQTCSGELGEGTRSGIDIGVDFGRHFQ
jgi:ribosomal protein L2